MTVKLCSRTAGASFALCGCLIIADAPLRGGNPRYSLWGNPFAVGVYVTAAIGVIGLACGVFNILSLARRRILLGEDDLRNIWKISAAPEYTWAQKRLLLAAYRGKWIQISGTVVDVDEWTGASSQVTARLAYAISLPICVSATEMRPSILH